MQTAAELAEKILRYKKSYYAGSPEISDVEYDALEEALRAIDPEHPVLAMVGYVRDDQPRLQHQPPMLSLDKTYSMADLLKWMDGRPCLGMDKLDGNALSLIYKDGRLVQAKTRGNGEWGESVLEKILWVGSVPQTLPLERDIEVRGELCCSLLSFTKLAEKMLERSLEPPTSPRNIVAGFLGRKKHLDLCTYFDFFAFDLLAANLSSFLSPLTEARKFVELDQLGFQTPRHRLLGQDKEVEKFIDGSFDETYDFQTDGAVLSLNDLQLHEELGSTAHHPRFKLSFKRQGEVATSTIKDITWWTSRNGIITPVAVIEPVTLSGAVIQNISLHNLAFVKSFQIKVGDQIEVVRSGEVIPKYLRTLRSSDGIVLVPHLCPSCNQPLIEEGVRLLCTNQDSCFDQVLGRILNWIRIAEIDDLSEKRLAGLMRSGLVKDIPDLYRLREEDLLTQPQMKTKMATKLITNIEESRKTLKLSAFLAGLGIAGMGETSWEKIIDLHPSLEGIRALTPEQIEVIGGFAAKSALQISKGLKAQAERIDELLRLNVIPQVPTRSEHGSSALEGFAFVITGSFSRTRDELSALIKAHGGEVQSAVSKTTTVLLAADVSSGSTKLKKAQSLGIKIWDEAALMAYISEQGIDLETQN